MNYLKQVNTFYKLLSNNPLSSNAQCLYFFLLNKNNELGWIKEFTTANSIVMGFTNLNITALQRARNELKQKGYIDYKKGLGNCAGTYMILELEQQHEQQYEQQYAQQTDINMNNNMHTLNKQNKTKQNETKQIKKKNEKKETDFDKLINENFSDENLKNTIYDFIKMRKAIKKPLTTKGLELLIKKLYELSTNVEEQIEILNNSIMNNWQGIFELKNKAKNDKGNFSDFKELWEEAKLKDEQTRDDSGDSFVSW